MVISDRQSKRTARGTGYRLERHTAAYNGYGQAPRHGSDRTNAAIRHNAHEASRRSLLNFAKTDILRHDRPPTTSTNNCCMH